MEDYFVTGNLSYLWLADTRCRLNRSPLTPATPFDYLGSILVFYSFMSNLWTFYFSLFLKNLFLVSFCYFEWYFETLPCQTQGENIGFIFASISMDIMLHVTQADEAAPSLSNCFLYI